MGDSELVELEERMDATGTKAREQHDRSNVLLIVAAGLLVAAVLLVVTITKNGLDATRWAFFLGLFVVTPASVITWILSIEAIRQRTALAAISAAGAYLFGLALFLILLVNLGGVQP